MTLPKERDSTQFRLRTLFMVVSIVAGCCAALAPSFRAWSGPQRQAFLTVLLGGPLGFTAISLLNLPFSALERWRAGTKPLVLRLPRKPVIAAFGALVAAAGFVYLLYMAFLLASNVGHGLRGTFVQLLLTGSGAGMFLATGVGLLRQLPVEFYQNGVVFRGVLIRWSLVRWEWDESTYNTIILQLGGFPIQRVLSAAVRRRAFCEGRARAIHAAGEGAGAGRERNRRDSLRDAV